MSNYQKIFAGVLISVFLITSGLGCKQTSKEAAEKIQPVNLVYWRTQDGQDAFSSIIQNFCASYPHISITYRVIRPEEYEQALLEAWAEDRGPDIFSIPNTWLGKYQTKILPLALGSELSLGKKIIVGAIKKEEKIIIEKKIAPDLRQLKEIFVETVPRDMLIKNEIWGVPLSLDILTLYYNRDFLNNAGLISPPRDWQEFVDDVKLLTLQDRDGNFVQSGAALGAADNVDNLTDLLSLLMLQNGTSMVNENGQATFNLATKDDSSYFPGQEAIKFYTSFSNPLQEIYSWNRQMPNSLESFIKGRVGFIFGYSDYLATIKAQAPKLNFDVAPVPQIKGSLQEVNYAQYWLETVSKKTKYPNEAWAFILFSAETKNAKTFIEKTKRPTAHRELIKQQLEDFDLSPFVKGVLTAKTWYKGKDYSLVKEAFQEMIKNVLSGEDIRKSIEYCVQKVNLSF